MTTPAQDLRRTARRIQDRLIQSVFPIIALLFTVLFLLKVIDIGFNETTAEPTLFIIVTMPLAALSLVLIWVPRRSASDESARASSAAVDAGMRGAAEPAPTDATAGLLRRAVESDWTISAGVIVGLVLFMVFIHFVGLLIGGGLFMLVMGLFLGYRNPLIGLPVIVGVLALIWLVFEYLLKVPLPTGPWGI